MKVGDLVTHKRTGALGLIWRVPKGWESDAPELWAVARHDVYYDVQWFDGSDNDFCTRHVLEELREREK